ncbi:MAG: hypothetical protein EBZ49_15940, partial [Proteobacteria bacterium]|nr:hypothetical protein [Pseudomonadota bacterium]
EMVKTEVIDSDAFYALERKKVKTREEFLRWVKYQTYLAFDIPITATFINDAEKQCLLDASNIGYKYFNLMTFVKQYKTIDDQVTYCKQKHVEQYDSILDTLLECDIDYAKPDKSIEEQLKSLLLKTSPKSAVIKMLTKDIYLKQYYTLRAIQSIGLTSGSDSTVVENLFLLTL